MIEQKVIIDLVDENLNEIGTLSVSAINYNSTSNPTKIRSKNITMINIPIVDEADDVTPIQYCTDALHNFANLMFIEEQEYQILFESDDAESVYDILYSITKFNKSHFKPFRFSLSESNSYKLAGTLNFRSYVGKSFLDVRKNSTDSIKIPIEVRSRKINYFDQYSAMIADLSQHSLNLIFEVNSPLYQEFELDYSDKETYYEDFMFLEYLFRTENLPSIFEYLSQNLHSQLTNQVKTTPISFAKNINQNTLKNIIKNPNNLIKTDSNFEIARKLNGYIPVNIDQENHEEIIDIAENRFLKYFFEMIESLIKKLLENSKEGYIKDKLISFNDEIEYYLAQKFFNHISEMDYVPTNSQILQKKEGYREIFQYFLMLEFSYRLSCDEITEQFKGFEKKLSELYEYWCYFKLLHVLNNMSVEKISFEDIFEMKDNWSIRIKRGVKSLKKFRLNLYNHNIEIELYYNLRFTDKSKYRSYSLAFKPDYTLLIKIANVTNYIHFDAKYRSELEIVDFYEKIKNDKQLDEKIDERDSLEEKEHVFKDADIYKMHTYKDSILKTEGSYVLYPGTKSKQFFETDTIIPSVGAFSLTPGNNNIEEHNLEIFIKEVVKTLLYTQGLINLEFESSK